MKATFYNNKSEDNRVDKELLYVANFDIILKTPSSIKNPVIDLQLDFINNSISDTIVDDENSIVVDGDNFEIGIINNFSILDFNYCYIEALKRYYFMDNPILVTDNIFRFQLKEDLLMSLKNEFLPLEAYILRSETNYDIQIPDSLCTFTCEKGVLDTDDIIYPTNVSSVRDLDPKTMTCMMTYITEDTVYNSLGLPQGDANVLIYAHNVGSNIMTQYQLVTIDELYRLLENIYKNDTLMNYLKLVKIYPFLMLASEVNRNDSKTSIKIGDTSLSLTEPFMNPLYNPYKVIIADFVFNNYSNEFYNYEPYSEYYIWIPYHKYVKVNYSDIYMQEIKVYYIVNFDTGETTVYIYNVDKDFIIYQAPCELGVKIGLTASNNKELTDQKMSLGISTALGVLSSIIAIGTGNPIGIASGVLSGVKTIGNAVTGYNTMYQNATVQTNSGTEGACNYQKVHIKAIRSIPSSYYGEEKFLKQYGRPLCKCRNLNYPYLKGYTQIGSIHLENIKAYDDEKAELESLLKQGIIL